MGAADAFLLLLWTDGIIDGDGVGDGDRDGPEDVKGAKEGATVG